MTIDQTAARAEAEPPAPVEAPERNPIEEAPHADQEHLRREVQRRARELAEGIERISAEFAADMLPRWKAHGVRYAVELRDRVAGIAAPDPEAAANALRAAGLRVIELTLPFAEAAVAAAQHQVWWRWHHGAISQVDHRVWLVWPGAELPTNERGEVALPEAN